MLKEMVGETKQVEVMEKEEDGGGEDGGGGGFGGIRALTTPSSRGASNRRRYGAEPLSRGYRRQLNTAEIHLEPLN